MSRRTGTQIYTWKERALSLLLCAVMLLGMAPVLTPRASAAHWADTYLDQLVDWGVMRADQTGNPDAPVTRADFAAIINRAYGYTETGPIPFTDVAVTDWFYDDICIAYTAGYMAGTSDTTASPNEQLTREMAVCILGRNMMMKETPGESLAFSDGRDVSSWARGLVKTAVDNYIVSGYPDNTFGPQDAISKGQMAALVTQCVGQPLNRSGTYSLGGVFGNVTITSPDVTLRDTTISGDLFISGGVGLGGVKLENVKVLGRIIVSSSGESESGDASVVMRNVEAQEMLVDNMRNKTVTVRADGITEIANTIVRTSAYLEDNNTDDKGLMNISLEGSGGVRLDLAGRIKNVVNKTPGSTVLVAKGTVQKLTVDEAAVNSGVQLDRNTEVKELNLDVATNVTGQGDIKKLNINAAGSTVTMLPDDIYIRPGLNANVGGEVIDSAAADEISKEPHILSGYPVASDVAPTGFQGLFAGNKKGTIYWGVSSITDGSIDAEALIKPPSYGSLAVTGGSVATPSANTEVTAQVTGLTTGGNYYLSAVLVDSQSRRSPVKVISFTTPDSTVPAFAQGYPYMSLVTDTMAQAVVMPTKSCKMYYAVLPRNAQAPTPAELKAASVIGNLGYGVVDVVKNTERVINLSSRLEELKDYTAYFWLVDANGVNSSAVVAVQFTTVDMTPPEFVTHPHVSGQPQANAVPMSAALNENGTIFWAVVTSGEDYPKPDPNNPDSNEDGGRRAKLDSDYAKLQVSSGMNAIARGQTNATADTPVTFNVTGLQPETAYDLYYLAQDTAGNYTITVYKLQGGIHTLDMSGPIVTQRFTRFSGADDSLDPINDTDVILEFNELVCPESALGMDFLTMYKDTIDPDKGEPERAEALKNFVEALKDSIILEEKLVGTDWRPVKIKGDSGVLENEWVVDYEQVRVTNEEGKMQVIFPGTAGLKPGQKEAIRLGSGSTYHFKVQNLTDNSTNRNKITPAIVVETDPRTEAAGHKVPQFTVVFAQLNMAQFDLVSTEWPDRISDVVPDPTNNVYKYSVDYSFRVIPDATHTVQKGMGYDLILWTDTTLEYDLYYRVVDSRGEKLTGEATLDQANKPTDAYGLPNMFKYGQPDDNGWVYLGNSGRIYTSDGNLFGKSLQNYFCDCNKEFPDINLLDDSGNIYYEFVISINRIGNSSTGNNPATWSGDVNFYVNAGAGTSSGLADVTGDKNVNILERAWTTQVERGLGRGGIASIGVPDVPAESDPKRLHMPKNYVDSLQPSFAEHYPAFEPSSNKVTVQLALDRPGTVKYAIAAASQGEEEDPDESTWVPVVTTRIEVEGVTGGAFDIQPKYIPRNGDEWRTRPKVKVTLPDRGEINEPGEWVGSSKAIVGEIRNQGVALSNTEIEGLQSNRTYYAYFVILGSAGEPSEIFIYKFKTKPTERPKIELGASGSGMNMTITNMDAKLKYLLYLEDDLKNIYLTDADGNLQSKPWMSTPFKSVAKPDLPAAYANYTILDALRSVYTGGLSDPNTGYSVFDLYASVEAKTLLVDWLTANGIQPGMDVLPGTDPQSAQQGEHDMREDVTQPGGTNAKPGARYYMLTMARGSETSGMEPVETIYSFRAQALVITDREPPRLIEASGNVYIDEADKKLTGGSVTLIFDKQLYRQDGTDYKLIQSGLEFFGTPALPDGIKSATVSQGAEATTVTLTLGASTTGGLYAVVPAGTLYNSGGSPAPQSLRIELVKRQVGTMPDGTTPLYKHYLEVQWGVRDEAGSLWYEKEAN